MGAEPFTDLSRASDSNNEALSGATWNFYETGTSTPLNVYSNAALSTSLGPTVTADSGGKFAAIFLDNTKLYRAVLKDSSGTTIKEIDPANSAFGSQFSSLTSVDEVFEVGVGGGFSTLNAALERASRYNTVFKQNGVTLQIQLNSGFVLEEQVFVVDQDLGHVLITSEDWASLADFATEDWIAIAAGGTPVDINWEAITNEPDVTDWRIGVVPAFAAIGPRAILPNIWTRFSFNTTGASINRNVTGSDCFGHVGAWIGFGAGARFMRTSGFHNAGHRGVYLDNGRLYARGLSVEGCGFAGGSPLNSGGNGVSAGFRASNASVANIRDSDIIGNSANLYINDSRVSAHAVVASGALAYAGDSLTGIGALIQDGATFVATGPLDLTNCACHALRASGTRNIIIDTLDVSATAVENVDSLILLQDCAGVDISGNLTATDSNARTIDLQSGSSITVDGIATLDESATRAAGLSSSADRTINLSVQCTARFSELVIPASPRLNAVVMFVGSTITAIGNGTAKLNGPISINTGSRANFTRLRQDAGAHLNLNIRPNVETVDGYVMYDKSRVSADKGDASVTLTKASEEITRYSTPITADRTVTVPSPVAGVSFRVFRESAATGAFNINIKLGSTTLKALSTAGTWAEVHPKDDLSGYVVTGGGTL